MNRLKLKKSILKNRSGLTIIELIIGIGLISIIGVGVSLQIINVQKEQKRQELLKVLTELKIQFETNIKNQIAWQNTINDTILNTNLSCVRTGNRCTGYVDTTSVNTFVNTATNRIVLKTQSNTTFYDGRATNNRGFTEKGQTCTGFVYPPGAGNDNCPIGYLVSFRALSTDVNPQILVSAKMFFNPSASHVFRGFINSFTMPAGPVVYGKYDIHLVRTAQGLTRSFYVTVPLTPVASVSTNCNQNGFGTCALSPAWTNYTNYSDNPTDQANDDFDLVTTSAANITIKQAGKYHCTLITSAFGAGNITAQLYQTSPTAAIIATQADTTSINGAPVWWKYTNIVNSFDYKVSTGGSIVYIRQQCGFVPTAIGVLADPNISKCALGFANRSSYTPAPTGSVPKASLQCMLLE